MKAKLIYVLLCTFFLINQNGLARGGSSPSKISDSFRSVDEVDLCSKRFEYLPIICARRRHP